MQSDIYTLPQIEFIGGTSKIISFPLTKSGLAFDAKNCSISFALTNFITSTTDPILTKTATLINDTNNVKSIAQVSLTSWDTKSLNGKFIYQLSVQDSSGYSDFPQGICLIHRNINPSVISD